MDKTAIGSLGEITADTPLQLAIAAKIAFPDGSITASLKGPSPHRAPVIPPIEVDAAPGKRSRST